MTKVGSAASTRLLAFFLPVSNPFMAGCATVIHGTSQEVKVNVQPPGSEVTVYRWNGEVVAGPVRSPATERIHRPNWRQPYLAVAWKPGYCPRYWVPSSGLSGAGIATLFTFILIIPGYAGIVDARNGSMYAIDDVPFRTLTLQEEPSGR